LLVGVNSSMISFLAYCEWWPLSRREIRSGTYGPITYWSALTLAGLPFHTLTSLVAVVAMFATANLPFAAVPTAWAALTLFSLEGHAFTLLGSFLGRDLGLLPIGVHLMHTAISTGFFLSLGSVIWPLKLFQYILGGKYTFAILAYKTFSETGTWEGAFPLSGANLSDIEVGLVATAHNRSFYCPDEVAATDCYGITGRDVLTSLQAKYDVADPDLDVGAYMGWLLLVAASYQLVVLPATVLAARPTQSRSHEATNQPFTSVTEASALLPEQ